MNAILDRLGAISDREKAQNGIHMIDEFTVVALRCFGKFKTVLGAGAYGPELEQCLRGQARSERDKLWQEKIRFILTNRIARGASTGRFGSFEGEGGEEVSITLADCFAVDVVKYRAGTWDGTRLEGEKSEPRTMSCFISSAKRQIKLRCLLYGEEHRGGEEMRWEISEVTWGKTRSFHSGFPGENLEPDVGRVWRSRSGRSQSVTQDTS